MPIPATGELDFTDIQTELGGVNPIGISEYYNALNGIPSTGLIKTSDFRGKEIFTREPATGENYTASLDLVGYKWYVTTTNNTYSVRWNGVTVANGANPSPSSVVVGKTTYYRGTLKQSRTNPGRARDGIPTTYEYWYAIYRIVDNRP